eukprot:CAMPEP_0173436372 /NCGR_PEP_ID=MMETSP1357-20121228/15907_1 /TAXON_ID=77926 /ORGANISM="Hemiselmis rufescens, Strain PCC563" /LENGTH=99 /DNA_ID=CAMNT_0014401443 /DNA_START=41 /DNA_END=340 /DNA_ORIENTATION=+
MSGTNPCTEAWSECTSMSVPSVKSKSLGMLCFILNIFLPGSGTLVAGLLEDKPSTMVIGALQFVLSWIIIGWIWSVWWGYLIFVAAKEKESFEPLGEQA